MPAYFATDSFYDDNLGGSVDRGSRVVISAAAARRFIDAGLLVSAVRQNPGKAAGAKSSALPVGQVLPAQTASSPKRGRKAVKKGPLS